MNVPALVCCVLIALVMSATSVTSITAAAQAQPGDPPAPTNAAAASRFRTIQLPTGKSLRVLVLTPATFDPATPAPVALLIPPGDQGEKMVEEGVRRYVESAVLAPAGGRRERGEKGERGERGGWVVVSPAAPAGGSFVDDPTPLVELIGVLPTIVKPESVHLVGVSNGGIAAMRLARISPARLASVVVLPGFLPDAAPDKQGKGDDLAALRGMPVAMFVGANDQQVWRDNARRTADALTLAGAECTFEIVAGQGHVLDLGPTRVIDTLWAHRATCAAKAAIGRELDDFHDAAAKADEPRYFAHFAPGAVFLGTDATERWTLDAFRAWVRDGNYFAPGRGWTYYPKRRVVTLGPDGRTAWFDEVLDNAKLGACRGTGVVVLADGLWKVAQYNLTVPVPNELMGDVVRLIRTNPKGADAKPVPSVPPR